MPGKLEGLLRIPSMEPAPQGLAHKTQSEGSSPLDLAVAELHPVEGAPGQLVGNSQVNETPELFHYQLFELLPLFREGAPHSNGKNRFGDVALQPAGGRYVLAECRIHHCLVHRRSRMADENIREHLYGEEAQGICGLFGEPVHDNRALSPVLSRGGVHRKNSRPVPPPLGFDLTYLLAGTEFLQKAFFDELELFFSGNVPVEEETAV